MDDGGIRVIKFVKFSSKRNKDGLFFSLTQWLNKRVIKKHFCQRNGFVALPIDGIWIKGLGRWNHQRETYFRKVSKLHIVFKKKWDK